MYWHFNRFNSKMLTDRILDELHEQVRAAEGRDAAPSAGIIDSQSVQAADTVAKDSRGYDAAKKINGRKRFIVTEALGLLVTVIVVAASVQDRDGAKTALLHMYHDSPTRHVFATAASPAPWPAGLPRR